MLMFIIIIALLTVLFRNFILTKRDQKKEGVETLWWELIISCIIPLFYLMSWCVRVKKKHAEQEKAEQETKEREQEKQREYYKNKFFEP